ncbi:hypothetical protein [Erwinia endophytica]|uniref:hypothetical protein n=1 Tax=Erwinia endophytica TaxID=1563158 RepID=UPI00186B7115|nr:hypothetical protein [Erwinia endophytica]
MDKTHFYQRLMRWQHLHFNDVVLREHPGTPAWNNMYEIYIQDNSCLSAQLYIRTTQPGENTTQVLEQYLAWLHEYNTHATERTLTFKQGTHAAQSTQSESYQRSPARKIPAWGNAVSQRMRDVQR